MDNWRICSVFNKQSTTHIVLNIYINSIVVLTVVLTPQSITTNTINCTLSSYSLLLFHPLQYNSHHYLSIFLIFKIIKTSFYPIIYALSYFTISYNLELSNIIMIYRRCNQTAYNLSFSKRLLVLDLPRYEVTTFFLAFNYLILLMKYNKDLIISILG